MKVLVIGYGSMGQKHVASLKINKFKEIYVLTQQKNIAHPTIKKLSQIHLIDPDYIIISSETSKHYKTLKYIEKNFKNKFILVEKPLFHKFYNLKIKNNKVFVGYDLRVHPIINFIKNKLKNKKIWYASVECGSFLPFWRKNIPYHKSSSAKKKYGGGVLLELSHELDYFLLFFKKFNILDVFNKKISNLKINTDDFLDVKFYNKDIPFINIRLNYFARKNIRKITIEGNNISINACLLTNKIFIEENGLKKKLYFKKLKKNILYINEHKLIKEKKYSKLCSYNQALDVMKYIDKIRKFNK